MFKGKPPKVDFGIIFNLFIICWVALLNTVTGVLKGENPPEILGPNPGRDPHGFLDCILPNLACTSSVKKGNGNIVCKKHLLTALYFGGTTCFAGSPQFEFNKIPSLVGSDAFPKYTF